MAIYIILWKWTGGGVGAIPHDYVLHIKYKNDMHVPPALHEANYGLLIITSWTIKIKVQSIRIIQLMNFKIGY